MQPPLLVLLLAFFLLPGTEAGEIIEGHEAKPHSRPYMAYLHIKDEKESVCGGFLVRKNFVLTAAHCNGSSCAIAPVTLPPHHSPSLLSVKVNQCHPGAHNIKKQEKTQQYFLVKRAIPHPDYNPKNFSNDIMLLQGDSGGPLLCKNEIQGIVSYGRNDGTPPRAYTKVASLPSLDKRDHEKPPIAGPRLSSLELIQDHTAGREVVPATE
ncbi:hypothetical protein QTO34_019391 [Cnephaeus nilssonii]|uniref:Peptidase S1 domain-containing protein n=1 Tax=Cnephaeus nilssonii TaxID=3371016 RepID=A0AA40HWG2_CNENI|nr:hypothetical protein QTO34_019391 [Eptesicus nilssonii]